jgi:hypothetical protein
MNCSAYLPASLLVELRQLWLHFPGQIREGARSASKTEITNMGKEALKQIEFALNCDFGKIKILDRQTIQIGFLIRFMKAMFFRLDHDSPFCHKVQNHLIPLQHLQSAADSYSARAPYVFPAPYTSMVYDDTGCWLQQGARASEEEGERGSLNYDDDDDNDYASWGRARYDIERKRC